MKIAVSSPEKTARETIRELLSPWDIRYVDAEKADVVISYDDAPRVANANVIIPSETWRFRKWLEQKNIGHSKKKGVKTNVQATVEIQLTITAQNAYCYSTIDGSTEKTGDALALLEDERLVLLNLDIVDEYIRRVEAVMNPKISTMYKVATKTPISYTVVPPRIRNILLRKRAPDSDLYQSHLSLDALRYLLVRALGILTNREPKKKLWSHKKYVSIITHDIETANGLRRSAKVERLEEKYDVPSAWYVPTEQYTLDKDAIRKLAHHGEIGSHDTKHDGKLIHLSRDKIIERVTKAKNTLTRITGEEIVGFRAPLLQHSAEILNSLRESGYMYDASIPSWEPNHPLAMKSDGIETVYPLTLNGVTEIPMTVPQDHQLLYFLKMNGEQILQAWTKAMAAIRELEGVVVLSIHPDYQLAAGGLKTYEELLNIIVADNQAKIATPKEIIKQDSAER